MTQKSSTSCHPIRYADRVIRCVTKDPARAAEYPKLCATVVFHKLGLYKPEDAIDFCNILPDTPPLRRAFAAIAPVKMEQFFRFAAPSEIKDYIAAVDRMPAAKKFVQPALRDALAYHESRPQTKYTPHRAHAEALRGFITRVDAPAIRSIMQQPAAVRPPQQQQRQRSFGIVGG